jgi:DtxR family Mn-dependent transcriptional regulator
MYLETISLLHEKNRVARVTDIARALGVSKPSVHVALHELERRGLVQHENYGEIFMTPAGREASTAIRSRHDLLTAFLRDELGVAPEIAEKDACRIEHIISEETLAAIAERCRAAAPRPEGGASSDESRGGHAQA